MMFVRTAAERDLPAVRDLLCEAWHATYDATLGPDRVASMSEVVHSSDALAARLSMPNSEFLVADDGTLIGGMAFAAADREGETVTLYQLYVRPSAQGHGIGGMLLEELLECFPDAKLMRLEVHEANTRALAFYESFGFSAAGRTGDCAVKGSGIPALILERPLDAAG